MKSAFLEVFVQFQLIQSRFSILVGQMWKCQPFSTFFLACTASFSTELVPSTCFHFLPPPSQNSRHHCLILASWKRCYVTNASLWTPTLLVTRPKFSCMLTLHVYLCRYFISRMSTMVDIKFLASSTPIQDKSKFGSTFTADF